jgi:large subunit ribosomal protein L30
MAQIVVTQRRSLISEPEKIRKVVKALGLGRINATKTHKDNNCIRGMINKVKHLVSYELKD